MRIKTTFVCVLACSVAISAICGPFCFPTFQGDVNGDRSVDILDIQALVARVLEGTTPVDTADVNKDGLVDVRDVQYALAHLNAQTSSDQPEPEQKKMPRAITVAAERHWVRTNPTATELLHPDAAGIHASEHRRNAPLIVLSAHTELYLFTLTPNAPPFLG